MPIGKTSAELQAAKVHTAAQALETFVLKQMVTSSKAFTGGDSAGSAVRADMFADALADALVKGGGIGLARQIEQSVLKGMHAGAPGAEAAGQAAPAAQGPAGLTVTSPFGLRHDPFDGHLARHGGVDLAGAEGAPIQAAAGGVVRRAGDLGGYGQAVEIDHGNGVTTLYAHASELLVHEGDEITPGQTIARIGHTGRATGPHLHFEVRHDGKPVDPLSVLGPSGQEAGFVQPLPTSPLSPPSPLRVPHALKTYANRAEEYPESGS